MRRLLSFISFFLIVVSCEKKIDPFVETDEGKNVLGFYLNGEKVTYTTSGGWGRPRSNDVYAKQINADSLEIGAALNNYYYPRIVIQIASADISTSKAITNPDITLKYLYRKYPLPPEIYSDGGQGHEYSYTVLVSGKLSFRKWDQKTGVLSGNFKFDCEAPQRDGSVKRISVTKGIFDVSTNNDDNE